MRKIFILLMPLVLTACVSTSVFAPKTKCSSLLPEAYSQPIPDAPAPVEEADELGTFKNWVNFALAQTAGKRSEFERAKASREIVHRCEERDAEAIKDSKPFLGIF